MSDQENSHEDNYEDPTLDAILDESSHRAQSALAEGLDLVNELREITRMATQEKHQPSRSHSMLPTARTSHGGFEVALVQVEGRIKAIELSGEINVSNSSRLREILLDVIDDGGLDLVVEMRAVTSLDDTGLGVLEAISDRLRAREGSMCFAGLHPRVHRLFHITGLDKIFVLHDTLEGAVTAVRGSAAQRQGPCTRPDV